jgi:murein DD-endopeptidase MepM/ murein hydrolase activator NlpD
MAAATALALLTPVGASAVTSTGVAAGTRTTVQPPHASRDDIASRLSHAGDDLAGANAAVARAAAQLQSAQTQLPAARSALAAAEAAAQRAAHASAGAAQAEAAARARMQVATHRVAGARAAITRTSLAIDDLVRAVYIQGPYVELAAVLSAATPSDFAERLEAVRDVSRAQNRTLSDLQRQRADLALAQAQAQAMAQRAGKASDAATAASRAAAQSAAQARAAASRIQALAAQRAAALAVAARERVTVKRQYDALRAEQQRLRRLERSSRGFAGRPSGSLIWPIPGAALVGGVGWRVHPVYGYRSCHTGVDIRGGIGTPIHAAAAGLVVSVTDGGAYGLHTLISHGGGLDTMYAHQSATAVHVGQVVAQGQVIGYVGASGWVTGPHLHFEVHVGGVPYDPLGWFGGERAPVACAV